MSLGQSGELLLVIAEAEACKGARLVIRASFEDRAEERSGVVGVFGLEPGPPDDGEDRVLIEVERGQQVVGCIDLGPDVFPHVVDDPGQRLDRLGGPRVGPGQVERRRAKAACRAMSCLM